MPSKSASLDEVRRSMMDHVNSFGTSFKYHAIDSNYWHFYNALSMGCGWLVGCGQRVGGLPVDFS